MIALKLGSRAIVFHVTGFGRGVANDAGIAGREQGQESPPCSFSKLHQKGANRKQPKAIRQPKSMTFFGIATSRVVMAVFW
ncbi:MULTISPECIES: hypothetical protein [unclassified Rhizobium]|uniref:hypothetical protein n=1 Tax=unclassified Rhizobium TaxID=2613769 RepID=UPI0013C3FF06|nr:MULTISPECIES: hypothetical protein [unclassified Rhizobium]